MAKQTVTLQRHQPGTDVVARDLVEVQNNVAKAIEAMQAGTVFASVSNPPLTTSSPGDPGQVYISDAYLYLCVAHNTWRRMALSTW